MVNTIEGFSFEDAVDYHYGRFPPKNLDYEALTRPLSSASAALARYAGVLHSLHNKELLLGPLRRQEAVVSSRIEGTIATLDEVLKFEAEQDDATHPAHYRHEVLEVFSYSRALNHAQKLINDGLPICERLIREAHSKLLFFGRGADKQPGEFKTDQNYVVDQPKKRVVFIPINENDLSEGFKNFEAFVNEPEFEPLIQTAITHVEFEALHPFKDGNGRVGRMLITLMLWDKQLIEAPHFYISGNLEDRRDEYIQKMRAVSSDDAWTAWCIFFLEAIEQQAIENLDTASKIENLYEEMKEEFRVTLSSQWSINALDFIFGRPVFRQSAFAKESGIKGPTAYRFTKLLCDAGLLTMLEPGSGRRPALFAFEPLLEIVRD